MKKTYFTFALLLASASMMAQTVYTNAELSSTSDVIGTARYVGMGGALGALGADISAIGSNPAAIGMYRRSDIALTALIRNATPDVEPLTRWVLWLPSALTTPK